MGFFAGFWTWLNGQLADYIGTNTARVAEALEPAIVTLATVYLMVWGYLHLTGRMAGEHADKAGVDRLIVTHVPPWNSVQAAADEAAAAFHGVVEVAHPGAEFWI